MTTDELEALFKKYDHQYLEKSPTPRHPRRDISAFLLLHELCPAHDDMVSGAVHDVIYLDPSLENLASSNITEEQVLELVRCGVRLNDDHLSMFA